MRVQIKAIVLFIFIFAAAYTLRVIIVPNVVPIAEGEQPSWQLQFAFALKSIENIGIFGMVIVLLLAMSRWLMPLSGRIFSCEETHPENEVDDRLGGAERHQR